MPEAIFLGRGFDPVHQKVSVYVDFSRSSIKAHTDVIIAPSDSKLKVVRLQCAQLDIISCAVNGQEATFTYADPLKKLSAPEAISASQRHMLLGDKAAQFIPGVREQGDLLIVIPENARGADATAAAATTTAAAAVSGMDNLAPNTLCVSVEYELKEPYCGVQFIGCRTGDPRFPHLFTQNYPSIGSTCCWVPCIEGLHHKITWELEFNYPKDWKSAFKPIDSANSESENLTGPEEDGDKFVAICTGDITEELIDASDRSRMISRYLLSSPTAPHFISFAIGPFQTVNLTDFRGTEEDDAMGSSAVDIVAYSYSKYVKDVKNTCSILYKVMDFYIREFGSYPFTSLKLCFVDDLVTNMVSSASLGLVAHRVLYPADSLDEIYETTKLLAYNLAQQWVGINIVPKRTSDVWLTIGIAHYMANLFMRHLIGNNDYRFRMKMAASKICDRDIGQAPLASPMSLPIDSLRLEFVELKAPVVLFILDRRIKKSGGSLGLSRVIPKILLQQMRGDLENDALSTGHFLKVCEKLTYAQLNTFANEWIFGQGYPIFRVVQRFNRKKMVVEMGLNQVQVNEVPIQPFAEDSFVQDTSKAVRGTTESYIRPVFTGSMTVRIHEADGTPYEHAFDLRDGFTKVDIQYNTKYKRIKRNREAAIRRAEAAAEAKQNPTNATAADTTESEAEIRGFGDVLQSDSEAASWRLDDWTAEEEEMMAGEAYEWVRFDADFEWICKVYFSQPEHMYISQLQQDRDVVAQAEAIQHLASDSIRKSKVLSAFFVRTLYDSRYYYGVRQLAATALATCATKELDWIGLYHLLKYIEAKYCHPGTLVPKPKDFRNVPEYYIMLSVIESVSNVRQEDGTTPKQVKTLLLELLRFNDNSSNAFSDSKYLSVVIKSLAKALCPADKDIHGSHLELFRNDPILKESLHEIERFQYLERFVSSFHNQVTQAALEAKALMIKHKLIEPRVKDFFVYTHPRNYVDLRLCAIGILMRTAGLRSPIVLKYALDSITGTGTLYFRRMATIMFIKGIAVRIIEGRALQSGMTYETMLVDETNVAQLQQRRDERTKKLLQSVIETLRIEFLYDDDFKSAVWDACSCDRIDAMSKRELVLLWSVLFEKKKSLRVKLEFPSFKLRLRAQHLGGGKVVIQRKRLRTYGEYLKGVLVAPESSRRSRSFASETTPLTPTAAATTPVAPASNKIRIKIGGGFVRPSNN